MAKNLPARGFPASSFLRGAARGGMRSGSPSDEMAHSRKRESNFGKLAVLRVCVIYVLCAERKIQILVYLHIASTETLLVSRLYMSIRTQFS